MITWQQIRKKVLHSGLPVLCVLLLVLTIAVIPLSHSTAYAATGPVTLSGTAGNAQVTLSWAAVPDATGYDVYRNSTKITNTPITNTTFLDTTVINGTTYSYTVSAILAGTSSAQSNAVSLMPQSTPGLLRGLATTTGVKDLTDGNNASYLTFENRERQTFLLPTPAKVTGLNAYGDPNIQIQLFDTTGILVGSYTPSSSPVNTFTTLNLQHVARVVLTNTNQLYVKNMYDLDLTGVPDANISPSGLVATPGNAKVTFNWNAVDGVTAYNLYLNGIQKGNKINSAPITGTTFTDTNVINGNTYLYYFAPVTPTGVEGAPIPVSAIPMSPAGLLRGLATTTGVKELTDGNNATRLTFETNGRQTFLLPTPAKITGLNAYGDPNIQIQLFDTTGQLVSSFTPSSSPVNAFTPLNLQHVARVVLYNTNQLYVKNMYDLDLTGVPDANISPAGLVATPGNAKVTFNWNAVDGVTAHNLYLNGIQTGNKINSAPITGTTFTDTNVINGNTYLYYLAPVTPTGVEGAPIPVSAMPISPAGLLRGLATTTGVKELTDGNNATRLTFETNGRQTFLLPTPAIVTGLNGYGDPNIQIQLFDKTGQMISSFTPSSSPVNTFTALNLQSVAKVVLYNNNTLYAKNMYDIELTGVYQPNAPVGLTGLAGDSQATLTWTASQSATGYNLYRDGVKINTAPVTTTTYTETGLVNGTNYAYYVTALNTAGESAPSNTVNVVPTAPVPVTDAPTNLTGTAGDAQVVLDWTAPAGAESYNVYRDGVKINTVPVTTTTFTDTALTNGTAYAYFVTAVNATGESAASNTISLTPQAPVVPVTNLLLNPGFENGTASNTAGLQVGKDWTYYVAPGATADLAVVTSPASSGSYAQKVSGGGIVKGNAIDVYQLVTAEANTAYTVSGMYYIESLNNAFVQLYIDYYDKDGRFIKSNPVRYDVTTANYVQLTNSFTTPDNTGSFRVYSVLRSSADNASGTFYVDDLSVVRN